MADIKIFGNISLSAVPTDDNDLVTKGYVDALVGGDAKSIITIPILNIAPSSSGQVFYKTVSSPTAFTFDQTNTVCKAGEAYEFYVIISSTNSNSSVVFPPVWKWSGGAPSITGSGLFVSRIFTLDSGRTWLAEKKRFYSYIN